MDIQKEREASLKVIAYNIGQLVRFRIRLEIEIRDLALKYETLIWDFAFLK